MKKINVLVILSLIITTVGITCFQNNNYNTVRVAGRVKLLYIEKFWNGNRFYLILERDYDGEIKEYEINEMDYYRLELEYVIIFMDGHIETLVEFKEVKGFRKVYNEPTEISEQMDTMPEYGRNAVYFIICLIIIVVVIIILSEIYFKKIYKKSEKD